MWLRYSVPSFHSILLLLICTINITYIHIFYINRKKWKLRCLCYKWFSTISEYVLLAGSYSMQPRRFLSYANPDRLLVPSSFGTEGLPQLQRAWQSLPQLQRDWQSVPQLQKDWQSGHSCRVIENRCQGKPSNRRLAHGLTLHWYGTGYNRD